MHWDELRTCIIRAEYMEVGEAYDSAYAGPWTRSEKRESQQVTVSLVPQRGVRKLPS